jgi:DNA-binding MarR family transcriptional regulator
MSNGKPDHVDELIEQWRRERPDLDVAPLAVVGRLFRATALADAALGPPLAALGLQPGWSDILAALRRSGPPFELSPTELMRATLLSSGGTTKRLDRMAEAGLVERRPDPNDRRGILVRLTRKGTTLIDRAMPLHLVNQERLLEGLGQSDRRTLEALLRKLLNGLERPVPTGGRGARRQAP